LTIANHFEESAGPDLLSEKDYNNIGNFSQKIDPEGDFKKMMIY
jgi:hypothetical protein